MCLGGSLGWAIISDIHGNLEALTAVLEDAQRSFDPERVICLGDIVGYGPNPCECVDLIMDTCDVVILGNHDQGALFDPEGFNPSAEKAIFWTRDQLENSNSPNSAARWEFLSERPRRVEEGQYLFVHGSARNPLNEYVFPEDICNDRKMERIFQLIPHYCFQGHTHVPGVFTEDNRFFSPADMHMEFDLTTTPKAMVNVGSVGQPRDTDPRACYLHLEPDTGKIKYRRVQYDLDKTIKKIYSEPELERFLGDRLREGR
jgi:diadenosine tetraphosphatase ApaH/serine/threonine PP2A family protein phosphatase